MTQRSRFRKAAGPALAALILAVMPAAGALATPSTQIWIPSTDVQPFGTFHFGFDTYIRTASEPDGTKLPPVVDLGLTAGILPFEKLRAEVGFDLIHSGTDADDDPLYFNGKIATPEDALFKGSPALAGGIYNAGTKRDVTDQNVVYGLAARTFPVIGRLSAGYYTLNEDAVAGTDDGGVLLSWDRTLSEISDRLWAAVDYMGGDNAFGALNFGLSWAFSPNTSVIFGYDIYNEKEFAGENTFTVQIDINFP